MITIIRGSKLVTGEPGVVHEGSAVVVENGKITDIIGGGKTPASADRILEVAGGTVLPGLINLHDHVPRKAMRIAMPNTRSRDQADALMRSSDVALAYHTAANILAELRSGTTTIRDFGLRGVLGLEARDAVLAGTIPGPRIIAGGNPLCIPGGHAARWGAEEVDGADEVVAGVRRQIAAGADCLKFMASGGLGNYPEEDPGVPELTVAELSAGVDEAHNHHKHTAAHAYSTESIRNSIEAGIDTIEHGGFLDEETVKLMVSTSTAHVPTISGLFAVSAQYRFMGNNALADQIDDEIIQQVMNSARLSWEAGVLVGPGTDTSGELVEELELIQEATGASTLDILECATGTAAKIARVDEDTGTIEPGKCADILLVDGDVLADGLDVLRKPGWVVARGVVFEGKPMSLGLRMSMQRGVKQSGW